MVVGSTNYTKLKTNLKLSIERLKLLEKKKAELGQKARREIGEFIVNGKYERARIRVENIIRDDYLVEAMEIIEMYCDLIIARFGLVEQVKTLEEGLAEAISSIIWAANRIENCQELKVIADLFAQKYGKQYAIAAQSNTTKTVNERLMQKLGVEVPPKLLVEKYLIEIAKSLDIPFEPDPNVMREDEIYLAEEAIAAKEKKKQLLIDFDNEPSSSISSLQPSNPNQSLFDNQSDDTKATFPIHPPPLPQSFIDSLHEDTKPDQDSKPQPGTQSDTKDQEAQEKSAKEKKKEAEANFKFDEPDTSVTIDSESLPSYSSLFPNNPRQKPENSQNQPGDKPDQKPALKPTPPTPPTQPIVNMPANVDDMLSNLPAVPSEIPNLDSSKESNDDDNIDFNDLAKRFEALKKRK